MSTPEPSASQRPTTWHGLIIGVATAAWLAAIWMILMSEGLNWSSLTGVPLTEAEQRAFDAKDRAAVIVAATGPVAIAAYAAIVRYWKTAAVYLVLALVLLCWMGSRDEVRDLFDPPPAEVENPGNDHCVPISGSDRTCPGG